MSLGGLYTHTSGPEFSERVHECEHVWPKKGHLPPSFTWKRNEPEGMRCRCEDGTTLCLKAGQPTAADGEGAMQNGRNVMPEEQAWWGPSTFWSAQFPGSHITGSILWEIGGPLPRGGGEGWGLLAGNSRRAQPVLASALVLLWITPPFSKQRRLRYVLHLQLWDFKIGDQRNPFVSRLAQSHHRARKTWLHSAFPNRLEGKHWFLHSDKAQERSQSHSSFTSVFRL